VQQVHIVPTVRARCERDWIVVVVGSIRKRVESGGDGRSAFKRADCTKVGVREADVR
jgi:hypothetical protein